MAETTMHEFSWPRGSWELLKRIVRAWYAAEEGGGEITQRKIAQLANIHPSQLSLNKAFLQGVGIVEAQDIALTEAGRNFGLGLYKENERVQKQGLQKIVRQCSVLKHLLDVIRGRGSVEKAEFEAELTLITKHGNSTPGFTIGVGVLQDILRESGLIEVSADILRPAKDESEGDKAPLPKEGAAAIGNENSHVGLRKIPIPVSASAVWFIEVGENPGEAEVENFIEVQKRIFAKK